MHGVRKPHLLVLVVALWLVGCGRGEERAPAPPPAVDRPAVPELPPVSPAERAEFAFERLTRGPLVRTTAFEIPSLQHLNLEHAKRDLVALPDATLSLLRDETRRENMMRLTPQGGARDVWHSVLDVLASLPVHPVDLALAWTEGVVLVTDVQLHRRAVRVLAATGDARAAPRLVALLRLRAEEREIGRTAAQALFALGPPWRQRALETVYRYGGSRTWGRIPLLVLAAAGDGTPDPDALAWWALLTETGSPVPATDLDRVLRPAWAGLVLRLRDDVWPEDATRGLGLAQRFGRLIAPARALEGSGGIPQPRDRTALLPRRGVEAGGRKTAAQARAALAEAGFEAHLLAVRRDLTAGDPLLRAIAAGSAAGGAAGEDTETHEAVVQQYVASLGGLHQPDPLAVAASLHHVHAERPEVAEGYAWTILERARPWTVHEAPLKAAYEVLVERDDERLREAVSRLIRSPDSSEAAVALALVRWTRDPRYIPAVLAGLEALPVDGQTMHRRLLVWLHTSPDTALADEDLTAFVRRYAGWIEGMRPAEAAALVSGLLDLGEVGATAYAEGLRGGARQVYVAGLLSRAGVLPLAVAEALLEPVDADTPRVQRYAVWIVAYRSAPTGAAPHVAAARERLDPEDRRELDDILEVLRHRAP